MNSQRLGLIAFIFTVGVFVDGVHAVEWNSSCNFIPRINVTNIKSSIYGLGEYHPYLVEDAYASFFINFTAQGNLSEYKHYSIVPLVGVSCDGNKVGSAAWFNIKAYETGNGEIFTDFVVESEFHVPHENKTCYVYVEKIYSINNTWISETGCDSSKSNCLCYVDGLVGSYPTRSKDVLTRDQFLITKQLENDRENVKWLKYSVYVIAGAAILQLLVKLVEVFFKKNKQAEECVW